MLSFLQLLVTVLWVLVLGRVIVSWVDPMGRNQLSSWLIQATEPMLAPIRRLMPKTGMIDFSPLVLMLVLGFLVSALR